MKILFLYPYPSQEAPSQRFRFEQYLDILKFKEVKYKKMSFWNNATWSILYQSDHLLQKTVGFFLGIAKRIGMLFIANQYDFIFIHREALPIGPPIMEWILAKILRKKIIYDFDDAIWLPNTSNENKFVSFLKWHSKVKSICKWSYRVSCGNEYLCEFARQYNQHVILNPTTIETDHLHHPVIQELPRPSNKKTVIGWTGSHSTLKYLEFIVPIMRSLEKKYPNKLVLKIIADKDPQYDLPNVEFVRWSKKTEMEDLGSFDIGIMPLPDDIWAKGKCGFKILQYMAMEIPSISSPVGVNTTIIDNEINGLLCTTSFEWENSIRRLIEDTSLRTSIGENGRKTIINRYSVRSNTVTFLSLFE